MKNIFIYVIVLVASAFLIGGCGFNQNNEDSKKEALIVETNSGDEIKTEYIDFANTGFSLKIPTSFTLLDEDIKSQKYSGDIPDFVYSNEDAKINVVISLTENKIENNEIENFQKIIINMFKDNAEILDTDYYTIDDHNVGKVKIITKASDTYIYNNMIHFSYDGKLVIVTFNCTQDLEEEWCEVGDFIIDSLCFE